MGWKDTVMMHPGEVTRIRIRFAPVEAPISGPGAPVPGINPYAPTFDPTAPHGTGEGGPVVYGYVWHCHILDHEDNEMMRPLLITNTVIPAVPEPGRRLRANLRKPAAISPPRAHASKKPFARANHLPFFEI